MGPFVQWLAPCIVSLVGKSHLKNRGSSVTSDTPKEVGDENASVVGAALRVINSMEAAGIIGRHAIGGSIGLLFYIEPFLTEDLDVFCNVPKTRLLGSLAPIYSYLASLGYPPDGEYISIEGVLVQFLLPPTKLVEEALATAVEQTVEGVSTRVFQYEYLLAVMAETNRPRDRSKLAAALDSAAPDEAKLQEILKRYNLIDKWNQITR